MYAVKAFAVVIMTGTALAQAPAKAPDARDAFPPGDAARGKALFEGKGECLGCHRVRDTGSRFGPDLTDIGSRAGVLPARGVAASPFAPIPLDIGQAARAQIDLTRAIVDPGADILPQNRTVRFTTASGDTVTARLLNQDTFSLQIIDTRERVRTVPKSDLRELSFIKSSPMPSYRDKLSSQEIADVVAYLVSLKGINQ